MLSDWLAEGLACPEPVERLTRPELVEGPPQPLLVLVPWAGSAERTGLALAASRRGRGPLAPRRLVELLRGDNQFDSFLRKTLAYLLGPRGTGRFRSERQPEEYLGGPGPARRPTCSWTSCASPAPC